MSNVVDAVGKDDPEQAAIDGVFKDIEAPSTDEDGVVLPFAGKDKAEEPAKKPADARKPVEESDSDKQDEGTTEGGPKDAPLPKELQAVLTKMRQKDRAEVDKLKSEFGKKAEAFDALAQDPRFLALLRGDVAVTQPDKQAQQDELAELYDEFGITDPKQRKAYNNFFTKMIDRMVTPKLAAVRTEVQESFRGEQNALAELRAAEAAHPDFAELRPILDELQESRGWSLPWEDAYRIVKYELAAQGAQAAPEKEPPAKAAPDDTLRITRKRAAAQSPPAGSGTSSGSAADDSEEGAFNRAWAASKMPSA